MWTLPHPLADLLSVLFSFDAESQDEGWFFFFELVFVLVYSISMQPYVILAYYLCTQFPPESGMRQRSLTRV